MKGAPLLTPQHAAANLWPQQHHTLMPSASRAATTITTTTTAMMTPVCDPLSFAVGGAGPRTWFGRKTVDVPLLLSDALTAVLAFTVVFGGGALDAFVAVRLAFWAVTAVRF